MAEIVHEGDVEVIHCCGLWLDAGTDACPCCGEWCHQLPKFTD